MFKQKISISINSKSDRDKLFDEFDAMMSNLRNTGQILGDYETPFVSENQLISYQTTLEEVSLSKKYYDEYTSKRVKEIEQCCDSQLVTEVIGKATQQYKGVCKCKNPDFYALLTYAFNDSGFIDCGTCAKVVPLYKLRQLSYIDRNVMLSWETHYKACDILQLGCTVGEKWATKQMSDPNSQLSKQGLSICDKMKELTGISTYYYLYNYRHISPQKDKARHCPSCNGEWLLKERLHNFYDFKCDNCKLLSSFSPVTK